MIPIADSPRTRSVPYVNVVLILINFSVFFYELSLSGETYVGRVTELDHFILQWGTIPACAFDALGWAQIGAHSQVCRDQPQPLWTAITSMFMHVGWAHLLGNMLFLWIFGDNVEEAMGHVRYAIFYLLTGVLASLANGLVDTSSLTPALGASGAIAGVMGAYIVLYPRAYVVAIIPFLFFIPFPVPAFIMIGLWFLVELVQGFASIGPDVSSAGGGVAYFAHIGGFVAGALLVRVFVLGRPRPAAARVSKGRREAW